MKISKLISMSLMLLVGNLGAMAAMAAGSDTSNLCRSEGFAPVRLFGPVNQIELKSGDKVAWSVNAQGFASVDFILEGKSVCKNVAVDQTGTAACELLISVGENVEASVQQEDDLIPLSRMKAVAKSADASCLQESDTLVYSIR
jgi:hypothetical protein